MGEVLLQEYDSEESRKAEAQEKACRKCEFDKSLEVMRQQPISFTSRSTVFPQEKSRYGFVGEAATVRWVIESLEITCGDHNSWYCRISAE